MFDVESADRSEGLTSIWTRLVGVESKFLHQTKNTPAEFHLKFHRLTAMYELKYIKRALDSGDQSAYDEAEERIQWQRSKIVVATGSITEVQKIKKFWQTKGIEVKTLADLDKVEEYMVEKYGGKAIKF